MQLERELELPSEPLLSNIALRRALAIATDTSLQLRALRRVLASTTDTSLQLSALRRSSYYRQLDFCMLFVYPLYC